MISLQGSSNLGPRGRVYHYHRPAVDKGRLTGRVTVRNMRRLVSDLMGQVEPKWKSRTQRGPSLDPALVEVCAPAQQKNSYRRLVRGGTPWRN